MTKPIPKKIAKLVLAEGDTTAAYDMEKVIVSAAGGTPFTSKMIDNSDDVGKKIVDSLKLSGKFTIILGKKKFSYRYKEFKIW